MGWASFFSNKPVGFNNMSLAHNIYYVDSIGSRRITREYAFIKQKKEKKRLTKIYFPIKQKSKSYTSNFSSWKK